MKDYYEGDICLVFKGLTSTYSECRYVNSLEFCAHFDFMIDLVS